MIRSQKTSARSAHNRSVTNNDTSASSTSISDINSYLGRTLSINHYQLLVESILGQGGFAYVFLVRSLNQQRYALKRMYVNNRRDLNVCQREITLLRQLTSHPNIVKYVDACIRRLSPIHSIHNAFYSSSTCDDDDAVHEILLLTEYCANGALIVSKYLYLTSKTYVELNGSISIDRLV
jgi:serine/threonine protein kinase